MILNSSQITQLGVTVTQPPFNAEAKLALQVWDVLATGNRKHGLDEQSAQDHLEAALRHVNATGNDPETGLPHRAHAAARVLLTLMKIARHTTVAQAGRQGGES